MKPYLSLIGTLAFIFLSISASAGQNSTNRTFFVGYETLEMMMNKFQYFAGEAGYRINSRTQLRLMVGEVKLTERHLSSKYEAVAVDGPKVEGYFRIYEFNYDHFFGKNRRWYFGANIGYVNDRYEHRITGDRLNNHTLALGPHIGFQKMDLLKIKPLYVNISMPFRYYFNPIPEQQWNDTKVLEHRFVNNLWLFLGYKF